MENEALNYFHFFYKDPGTSSIVEQMSVITEYPSYFIAEELSQVVGLITLEEVKKVLEGFEKEKSLGPDGWTMDFF